MAKPASSIFPRVHAAIFLLVGVATMGDAGAMEPPPPQLVDSNGNGNPQVRGGTLFEKNAAVPSKGESKAADEPARRPGVAKPKSRAARKTGASAAPPRENLFSGGAPPDLPSEPLQPVPWTEIWRVRDVGRIAGTSNQIAVRGPLVVVASGGEATGPDARDGIYVIDGRRGLSNRIVRRVSTPDDAYGVALVGDDVVFATGKGSVVRMRLDGAIRWTVDLGQSSKPTTVSVNADVPDSNVPNVVVGTVAVEEGTERPQLVTLALENGAELRSGRWTTKGSDCLALFPWASVVACVRAGDAEGFNGGGKLVSWQDPAKVQVGPTLGRSLLVAEDLLGKGRGPTGVLANALSLRVEDSAGVQELAGASSLPSLGDVDQDGKWDVVVAVGRDLVAYATGSQGQAARLFPRGDAQASGRPVTARVSPASYASHLPPGDTARWLVRDVAPTDVAFERLDVVSALALAATSPRVPQTRPLDIGGVSVPSEDAVDCNRRSYAVHAGALVTLDADVWRLIKGAPAPISRVMCEDGFNLLVRTPLLGTFRLPPPLLWQRLAWILGLGVPAGVLLLALYSRRRRAAVALAAKEPQVRRRFISDSPRERLRDGHPAQQRLVSGLVGFLDNEDTRPPVTVALYGAWGSGKSSIMKMVRSELQATGRYIDVWFNAWRFHREAELGPALLQTIVDEISRRTDWVTRVGAMVDRVRNARARDVLFIGVTGGAAVLSLMLFLHFQKILGSLSAIVALGVGVWQKVLSPALKVFSLEPAKILNAQDSQKRIAFISDFGAEFQRLLRRLPRNQRLAIFVDDVDRCAPDRIVNLLETLNMLADAGAGFFVLATDRDVVRRAVELVHAKQLELMRHDSPEDAARYGARYLDKIVTVGVNVPLVAPDELNLEPIAPERMEVPVPEMVRFWARVRSLLRPRPSWAFAAAAAIALVWPLWATVKHFGGPSLALDALGLALNLRAPPPPTPITAPERAPQPPPSSLAVDQSPSGGVAAVLPPAKRTKTRTLAGEIGAFNSLPALAPATEPAPALPSVPLAPRAPADERSLALTLVRLLEGAGILSVLVLGGLLLAEREQRRKLTASRPQASDGAEFAQQLKEWKKKLPKNPRATIRFINAARFLYHVVGSCKPEEKGWEGGFFTGLYALWTDCPPARPLTPDWLNSEMNAWSLFAQPRGEPPSTPPNGEKREASVDHDA